MYKYSRSINKTTSFSTYFWLQPVYFSTVMQDKKMAVINFNDSLNNREQVHIALAPLISTIINVPTTWRNTLLALTVKISHSWELARLLIKIICQKQINPVVKLILSHWWVKFVYHMKFCGQCCDNILQSNARRGVTSLMLWGVAGDEILFAFAHIHTLAQIIWEILTEYISKLLSLGAITLFSFISLKNTNLP